MSKQSNTAITRVVRWKLRQKSTIYLLKQPQKLLDVELVELDDWNCCGASSGHNTDYELSLALPARNLAIAEKAKLNMAVPAPLVSLDLNKLTTT